MVGFKKRLWFMLMVFLVYLGSPGYPDSKKPKTIHNLPVNQDMGTKSWRHSKGGDKIELEAMKQEDCLDCWGKLNDAIRCRHCVDLREDCKDCCFSGKDPDTGIIKCTEDDDEEEDYACKYELFDRDDCEQIVCDPDECNTKCTNSIYGEDSPCNGVEETGGKVADSAAARRWQRKGCPEEDSPDLAPDGDCEPVETDTKTGLERIWECKESDHQPEFSGCDLTAKGQEDSGLSKPTTGYYSVVEIRTTCESSCKQNECDAACPTTSKGECSPSVGTCTPSCTPRCIAKIISGSSPGAGAECTASGCEVWQSCKASCAKEGNTCAGKCSSDCGTSSCESYSSRWPESQNTFYVYTLSDNFKNYIKECIDYADKYDACMDRVNCCEKGVCRDISVKKTKGYECAAGFSDNCDDGDCKKRKCYHDKNYCDEFTAVGAKNSCPKLASDVHSCLTDEKKNSGCFKEVKIDDEPFYYSYVASSNDALNIIWQITSTSSDKDVKGLNFYTLVKVFKLDANGKPERDPVHTSMANVKSQEAAFSIYGTTNVAKGRLDEGASYQVYLYYSLPPGEFCKPNCECLNIEDADERANCEAKACKKMTIELTYVSLILQRVRE